ncbi:hypothetical protein H5410_038581 [Solanum commersonii]|uniref:Strictosidine synthase n=1 Tax=Solanum commersonii TaxID=4109 RepID=A0A9J5YB38_SOLCO|nr:hypothetical protein H5410_038581 [Solanum commersonii]
MNTSNILLLIIATQALFASVNLAFDDSENALKSQNVLSKSEIIQLNGAIGPESVAFDPNGEGPYIGVADGRILKFQGSYWTDFAVTSSRRENCTLPFAPEMEHICGRPLGLRFDTKTGELYIADAYFGIQVVGPKGGLATPLVQKLEGKPLVFTNDVDIDDHDDVIYFTDTSTSSTSNKITIEFFKFGNGKCIVEAPFIVQQLDDLLSGGLLHATAIKLSEDGRVLEVLEDIEGKTLRSISEVQEKYGKLWFGSVMMPFLGLYGF